MKAIAYVRVSTGSQTNERQIEDIKRYCLNNEIELLEHHFEETEHGTMKIRPVLTELENFVQTNSKDFDYVIIHELSRLGRTQKVLDTKDFLHSFKIGLISLKENLKTLTADKKLNPEAVLMIGILSSINQHEIETTKYRSKSGLENIIRKGKCVGSLNYPYGYTKEKHTKKLIIDPSEQSEAETIKLIFKLYLEDGFGTKKITNYLNEQNIPTRSQITTERALEDGITKKYKNRSAWVDGTIYAILKNPLYKGYRRRTTHYIDVQKKEKVIKRPVYELLHFPQLEIITPEKFDAVQNLLKSNFNKSGKHTNKELYAYILEPQKILCGCCAEKGLKKHFFAHRKKEENESRYMCISRRYKGEKCENAGISIQRIETIIQQIILFFYDKELISKLDNKTLKNQINELEKEVAELRTKLVEPKETRLNLARMRAKNQISEGDYITLIDEADKEEKSLLNILDVKLSVKFNLNTTYSNLTDLRKLKLDFYKGSKIPKDVINKIIQNITITKKETDLPEFLTRRKQDKVMELKINSIDKEYKFLISQRTKHIFYFRKSYEDGIRMEDFLVQKQYSKNIYDSDQKLYTKERFDIITQMDEDDF